MQQQLIGEQSSEASPGDSGREGVGLHGILGLRSSVSLSDSGLRKNNNTSQGGVSSWLPPQDNRNILKNSNTQITNKSIMKKTQQ